MARGYSSVLVTGGAGFIGSHLVDRLLSEGFGVTVVDNLVHGQLKNLAHNKDVKDLHFIKGDIRDLDLIKGILIENDVDAVFHEAALVNVVASIKNPLITHDVNVTGTLNLLKACLDAGVKRFLFASSAGIYGETDTLPMKEDMTPRPRSPYAVSKLVAENYVSLFCNVYGLDTVCLRYFNVYGPRQIPYSGVISIIINRVLNHQSPIIYGDGEQTRDFVNVQDVVEANMLALWSKNVVGEIFNIGTGEATSVNHLTEMLLQMLGKTGLNPVRKDPRPGETSKGSEADISKARRVFGYTPRITLKEGIAKLVESSRHA